MLGAARGGLNATTLAGMLDRTRKLTTRPFGVNFIMRPGGVAARSPRQFIEQAASAARAVEFFYTDPNAEFVRIVHDHGALASWQVGSREEALAAAEAGCDLIIAQGIGAGGHVRGTIGLLDLLCEVLESVPEVPVLAAGGIGNGRAMAAALAAGADGVRVGTRFVAAEEAGVHPVYTEALTPPARRIASTLARSTSAGRKRRIVFLAPPSTRLRRFRGRSSARWSTSTVPSPPFRASRPRSPITPQRARLARWPCMPASRSAQ